MNLRNNSSGNITFGNNVVISGSGLALLNPLSNASPPATATVTMGNLKIGAGQELGVHLNTGTAHTIIFPTVTLTSGMATFSPKPVGFGATTVIGSDLSLGDISQQTPGAGITMAGLRTLFLTGTNTYTGPTNVNSGTLLMNGTHTSGGAYTVANGATLGGTGTIGPSVTVSAGGFLAPGSNGIGTLNTSSVSLAGTLNLEVDGNSNTQDLLNVTGAFKSDQRRG